jgi:hypothetical protein
MADMTLAAMNMMMRAVMMSDIQTMARIIHFLCWSI